MCEIFYSSGDEVSGRGSGHLDVMGNPADGVGDSDCVGGRDVYAMAAVMIESGSNIPSVNAVWGP